MNTIRKTEALERLGIIKVEKFGDHYTGFRWVVMVSENEKMPDKAIIELGLDGHRSKVVIVKVVNPSTTFHYDLDQILDVIVENLPLEQKAKLFEWYGWDGLIRKIRRYEVSAKYGSLPKAMKKVSVPPYRPLSMFDGVPTPGSDFVEISGEELPKFIEKFWWAINDIKEV